MWSTQRDGVPNSVVGRAVAVLTCFGPNDAELRLSEITRRTAIPKATVHRLVGELARWGMLEQNKGGVRLGLRMFELGQLAPTQRDLRETALPFLSDLHEATHSTVHLAVLDGLEVVYVEKIAARSSPKLPSRAGGRMPLYCTGVGKVLLAYSPPSLLQEVVRVGLVRRTPGTIVMPGLLERELDSVRRQGFALEREESTKGAVCAAAPIHGADGRLLAAISVAGWAGRMDVHRVAPAVRTAALALSRQCAKVGADGHALPRAGAT